MRPLIPALAVAATALTACDNMQSPGDPAPGSADPYEESETYTFVCDEMEVEAQFLRQTARIVVDSATYDLNRVEAETGSRYVAPNDDALFFHVMGEAARLSLPGEGEQDCRMNNA